MAMTLINPEKAHFETSERVVIQADDTPETFPTSGVGVDGLPDAVTIKTGSILYTLDTSKKYLMDSTGEWKEWTA